MSEPQEGQVEIITASYALDEIIPEWVHPLERDLYLAWRNAVTSEPPLPNLPELPDEMRGQGIARHNKLIKKGRKKK